MVYKVKKVDKMDIGQGVQGGQRGQGGQRQARQGGGFSSIWRTFLELRSSLIMDHDFSHKTVTSPRRWWRFGTLRSIF